MRIYVFNFRLVVCIMDKFSEEFLQKTVKVWQPFSTTPLSLEDAREIAENMTELFLLLKRLDQKYNKKNNKNY